MIIDAHVHLRHGDERRTEYKPESIVEIMDAVGIDKSVVLAICTTTSRSIHMARRAAGMFPRRLIPFAYALPSFTTIVMRELEEALLDLGFKGVKIHAGECGLAEYTVGPVIGLAGEMGVPCLIDCLGRYADIERMARAHPDAKIIVAHMGKYMCTDEALIDRFIQLAEEHENLYLDTSGVVLTGKIVEAVDRVGADRLIFGTDGPRRKPTTVEYAREQLEKIRGLPISTAEKAQILGRTIADLLEIPAM